MGLSQGGSGGMGPPSSSRSRSAGFRGVAPPGQHRQQRFEVTTHGGRIGTGIDATEWARRAVQLGAGEILLNSMDADGTTAGFDLELIRAVRAVVTVPVIASGGAGSLAHEWTHALDHYLGEQHQEKPYGSAPVEMSGGRVAPSEATYYSNRAEPDARYTAPTHNRMLPPKLKHAANQLMHSLFFRSENDEEVQTRFGEELKRAEQAVANWQRHAESARDHLRKKENTRYWNGQLNKAEDAISWWQDKRAAIVRQIESVGARRTLKSNYYENAMKLSGSGDYWKRSNEMLARAMESYIFDKVAKEGNLSQYLVQGVEPNRFGNGFRGNPFPAGEEREAINQNFDHLFKALETGEGKLGKATKLQARQGELEPSEISVPVPKKAAKPESMEEEAAAHDEAVTEAAQSAGLAEGFADRLEKGEGFENILAARRFAKEAGQTTDPKEVEEALEQGVIKTAHRLIGRGADSPQQMFKTLVNLYKLQPKLGTRTSTSVRDQAYSTPIPLAYLASRLAGINADTSVYEPTAGNGALLIEANPEKTFANEINPKRAEALMDQGFNVTRDDASVHDENLKPDFDVVIANPPFGVVKEGGESKVFDMSDIQPGYKTTEIDHAIALRSLAGMKPDGRALLSTIARAEGDPARAVMVGDSKTDVAAARSAGAPVVAVDFGYSDPPVATFAPDRLISHFDELWEAATGLLR